MSFPGTKTGVNLKTAFVGEIRAHTDMYPGKIHPDKFQRTLESIS